MKNKPPKEYYDLRKKIEEYEIIGGNGLEGIKEDAPEDVKAAFTLLMKKYIIPAREAQKNGELFT